MEQRRIKVMIVDDSAFRCKVLDKALRQEPELEVLGFAGNGMEAYERAKDWHPDVITMDVQMPIMNGFEAIAKIMTDCPCPIIATSGLASDTLNKALQFGAMDCVAFDDEMEVVIPILVDKIKIAARIKPIRRIGGPAPNIPVFDQSKSEGMRVIAVGVSTGGPVALEQIFSSLPANFPGVFLVVQHMMPGFTQGLVQHLQSQSPLDVQMASDGQALKPGQALIAPEHQHLRLNVDRHVELVPGETNHGHEPSIDVTMQSVALAFHRQAVGILLTGMGDDGVRGMQTIQRWGGTTLAQDESSSVIFGMNRLAIERGYVDIVATLTEIGCHLNQLCKRQDADRASGLQGIEA